MRRYLATIGWLAAWLAAMSGLWLGLTQARRRTIAALENPAAQAEWQAYLRAERERADDPSSPVRRRVPTSPEPPALVLLRDHFPAVLATTLMVGTVLFGFVALVARGVWRQRPR